MPADRIRIEVVVAADGSVTAETQRAVGEQCLPYIHILEDLLDAKTVDSSYTDDWWKSAAATVHADETVRLEDRS